MATSGGTQDQDTADILCGICESQHITKCADHWCPECEEGLCYGNDGRRFCGSNEFRNCH
jgi:hypothetical protein